MTPAKKLFLTYVVLSTVAIAGGYLLLRGLGLPIVQAATYTAIASLLTPMSVALKTRLGILRTPEGMEVKHVLQARMLPFAVVSSAACMAAAHAGGGVGFFLIGFFGAIGYGVLALIKEIDDFVPPSMLLFSILAQSILILNVVG